jgi:branched-chain amino acid transport system substrate-binding protein
LTVKKSVFAVLGLLVAAFALVAAGCGGGGGGGGAPEALPSSSCTALDYGGEGDPDYILTTDLPLQGSSRVQNTQIVAAVKYQLQQQNYKAGDYNIAFQSCDNATAQAGGWDSGKCSANANAYAGNDGVIGVIGTFNSGCAAIEIPVLNQAPDGGIPMLSPANTYVCLTAAAPSCDSTEPDKYYPSGTRNYLRVVANDAYQGSADAEFAQSLGVKSVYILNDKQAYGLGVATNFRDAAQSLGIKIAGFAAWDSKASSYTSTFDKIKQTGADAVFLGGLIDENGGQLIKDKVAVLGPNTGAVKLLAPDGFTQQSTIVEAGSASADMYLSVAGQPIDRFQGKAKEFLDGLRNGPLSGQAIDPYAIYGGQAAQVFLDAIAASDGSRSDVISKLFASKVQNGLLGSFTFNEDGDPVASSGATVAVTIYKAADTLKTETTIAPKQTTVDAALGK